MNDLFFLIVFMYLPAFLFSLFLLNFSITVFSPDSKMGKLSKIIHSKFLIIFFFIFVAGALYLIITGQISTNRDGNIFG